MLYYDPASSWFEIVEFPVADHVPTEPVKKDGKTKEAYLVNNQSNSLVVELVLNGAVDPGLRPRLRSKCRRTRV